MSYPIPLCRGTLTAILACSSLLVSPVLGQRLWDQEPSLWEAAQQKRVTRRLSKDGPPNQKVIWVPEDITQRFDHFRMNNRQMKISLWGTYDNLVLSLGKTDVWDRRYVNCPVVTLEEHREALFDEENEANKKATEQYDRGTPNTRYITWAQSPDQEIPRNYHWKAHDFPVPKPVGQVILSIPDLRTPESSQDKDSAAEAVIHYHDGTVHLESAQGETEAKCTFLTMMSRNVIAVNLEANGLRNPISLRLFRHQDICKPNGRFVWKRDALGTKYCVSEPHEHWDYSKHPEVAETVEPPHCGREGRFFWISQKLPAEKTFPNGFEYVLMGVVLGSQPSEISIAEAEKGLGQMSSCYEDLPGWAATAEFSGQDQLKFTCLLTVATSVDGHDVFDIARKQLIDAMQKQMSGLIAENATWYRDFYDMRENGRIFDGTPDRASKRIPNLSLSWVNLHSRENDPDPYLFEADAWYGELDTDWSSTWHDLSCYNEIYFTHYAVMNRLDMMNYQIKLPKFTLEASKRNARDVYGLEGAFGPAHGFQPPTKLEEFYRSNFQLHFCTEVPGQVLKCAWDAWDYGGNEEVLTEFVYPPLREQAIFVSDYLTKGDDGYYHVIPSMGGEHWGWTYQYKYNKDNTAGVAMFKWALLRAAEAADFLEVDEDKADAWRELAKKIVPYPTWETDSGTVFTDAAGVDPLGREFNNAIVTFPACVADLIHLDSDRDEIETMLRTAKLVWGHRVNRQTYHLLGRDPDILHYWWPGVFNYHWETYAGGDSYNHSLKVDATLELDTPDKIWDAFFFEPERLCNSRSGRIHLFPCVPEKTTIAFKKFLARGGFEVSAEMIEGNITYLEIVPRRDSVCKLMNPWNGSQVSISGSDQSLVSYKVERSNSDCIVFNAREGVSYVISKAQ